MEYREVKVGTAPRAVLCLSAAPNRFHLLLVGRSLPWPPFAEARANSRARSPTIPRFVRPRMRCHRIPTQETGFPSRFTKLGRIGLFVN